MQWGLTSGKCVASVLCPRDLGGWGRVLLDGQKLMMNMAQAAGLGVLQGVSELFPISSLAQTILIPALLGWDLGAREQSNFLAFVVALHLATAIALLIYFWSDWKRVFAAYVGSIKRGKLVYDADSKFAWLLVAGTIVVGLLGVVFEKKLRQLFENPKYYWIIGLVLVVNGFIMMFADVVKRRMSIKENPQHTDPGSDPALDAPQERKTAEQMTFIEGVSIGATQSFALIPGISRSGVTIVTALFAGLSYEEASRFSFMLATYAIGGAAILKVPSLFKPENRHVLMLAIPSSILAGITAYLSTRYLMRYFRHNRLTPFGWYCIVFGAFAAVILKMHGPG